MAKNNDGSYSTAENPRYWGWWNDENCRMEMNRGYAMIMSFTLGFLVFDTLKMLTCIENKSDRLVK